MGVLDGRLGGGEAAAGGGPASSRAARGQAPPGLLRPVNFEFRAAGLPQRLAEVKVRLLIMTRGGPSCRPRGEKPVAEPREHETMTAAPEGAVHDVVVVGSGAAAMTAAVVAGLQGLSVLLVEKAPVFGGAGALSGGVAWLPGNPHARGDSLERTVRYLENVVRPAPLRRSLVEAFYAGAGPMLRLLEERTAVRFGPTTYVDYKSHLDGAMAGARSIAALPYDGRELGAWFRRLRAPMPELCVLGSMMVSAADVADFERMGRSPAALARVLRRLAEFG